MASRRKNILNTLKSSLRNINGGISSYDSSYTYQTNVNGNVDRGLKFLDEINDFPSIFVLGGEENREYNTDGLTIANLPVTLYLYVMSEETAQDDIDNLAQDIEHIIYSLPNMNESGVLDITIERTSKDEGLLAPYGIGEIELLVLYEIAD